MKPMYRFFCGFFVAALVLNFQNCGESINYDAYTGEASSSSNAPGAAAMINSIPSSMNQTVGDTLIITAQVSGDNVSYAWYKNGLVIAGANSAILTRANLNTNDSGTYQLQVSNSFGSDSANISVTVAATPPPPTPPVTKPVIATAPVNVEATHFGNNNFLILPYNETFPKRVSFTVVASGQNLTYQWYFIPISGSPVTAISGATAKTYFFDMNSISQAGTYRINVSNSGGSVSGQATLTYEDFDIGPIGF